QILAAMAGVGADQHAWISTAQPVHNVRERVVEAREDHRLLEASRPRYAPSAQDSQELCHLRRGTREIRQGGEHLLELAPLPVEVGRFAVSQERSHRCGIIIAIVQYIVPIVVFGVVGVIQTKPVRGVLYPLQTATQGFADGEEARRE